MPPSRPAAAFATGTKHSRSRPQELPHLLGTDHLVVAAFATAVQCGPANIDAKIVEDQQFFELSTTPHELALGTQGVMQS